MTDRLKYILGAPWLFLRLLPLTRSVRVAWWWVQRGYYEGQSINAGEPRDTSNEPF